MLSYRLKSFFILKLIVNNSKRTMIV